MLSIQFIREKMNNYMVISCDKYIDRTSYSITVMEVVDIPGFMSCQVREIDGQQSLYYKLKYRTSVKQVLGNLQLTYSKVNNMLSSIVCAMRQAEEYLLDIDCIIWRSDCVFIEVSTGKLVFCYCPTDKEDNYLLQDLLIEIAQCIDKSDQQTYMHFMGFYNIVTNPDCSLEQICEYVEGAEFMCDEEQMYEYRGGDEKGTERNDYEEESAKQPGRVDRTSLKDDKEQKHISNLSIIILSVVNLIVVCLLLFEIWTYQYIWVLLVTLFLLLVAFLISGNGEEENPDNIMKEYLEQEEVKKVSHQKDVGESLFETVEMEEETTLLTVDKSEIVVEEQGKELYIKAMNPKIHKDILIKKKSVVLGSMRTGCDYILKEKGISRMHAKILKKDDGLFLMDMNSTNGTYLNEKELVGGKEYLLKEGDVFSLAYMVNYVVVEKEIEKSLIV